MLRHLPATGWLPTVLTAYEPGRGLQTPVSMPDVSVLAEPMFRLQSVWHRLLLRRQIAVRTPGPGTESLLDETTGRRSIRKRLIDFAYGWIYFPDDAMFWIPLAVCRGIAYGRANELDAVYSSSPKVSSHVAASLIGRSLRIPWIMEFRDLWVHNPWAGSAQIKTHLRMRMDSYLERRLVCRASAIVVVSEGNAAILRQRYGNAVGSRIHVVPNGFDRVEYPTRQARPANREKLAIVHTGIFYGGRRDISGLLRAIAQLVEQNEVPHDAIEVLAVGDTEYYAQELATRSGLAGCVRSLDRVSLDQSLRYQVESDLLLLVESGEDTQWARGNPTGKVYEYLGAGRPILALVNQEGVAADIVRKMNTGVVVAPQDVKGICRALRKFYGSWQKTGCIEYSPDVSAVAQYEWSRLIELVGDVLDQTAASGRVDPTNRSANQQTGTLLGE